MTLIPYTISDACRKGARQSGFDIDNPDIRHPVQNPTMEKVIAERSPHDRGPRDPRAQLLLKGRQAMTRVLNRKGR